MFLKTRLINYLPNGDNKALQSKIDLARRCLNLDNYALKGLELYDEFMPNDSRYDMFVEKLMDTFDIRSNILEIGGGKVPNIGKRIAQKQIELGKGTITVYDPCLVVTQTEYPNLILCRDSFSLKTDISSYDMLIGSYPCEATELIIERAIQENISFFIQICNCVLPLKKMTEQEYVYYSNHPDVYKKMLIDNYVAYSKKFKRDMCVNTDLATPSLICKKK